MAGEIEEPMINLDFQAASFHSGSISFGRFENEALCWERRSSFSHNRYLEEVEKCSKPGLVIEKKAYFEAHFRKKGIMGLNSPESRNGTEYQTNENDISDRTIIHMNEEIYSPCFDEVKERETEVSGVSTPEVQNEILRDGGVDSAEIEVKEEDTDSKAAERSSDASRKEQPCSSSSKEKSSSQDEKMKPGLAIRVCVSQSERHISSKASKGSDKKTSKTANKIPTRAKAEQQALEAAAQDTVPMRKTLKNEPISKARGLVNEIKRGEKEPRNRRNEETRSSSSRKVPSRVNHSENRIKPAVVMTQPHIKQNNSKFGFKCNERAEKRKEFDMKIEKRIHAKEAEMNQLQQKIQEKTEAQVKLLRKSLNFKAKPLPSFYHGVVHESLDRNKAKASNVKPRKQETKSSTSSGNSRGIVICAPPKTSDPSLASGATSCHSTVTSESSPSSPAAEISKTTRKVVPAQGNKIYKGKKTTDGNKIKHKKISTHTALINTLESGCKAVVLC